MILPENWAIKFQLWKYQLIQGRYCLLRDSWIHQSFIPLSSKNPYYNLKMGTEDGQVIPQCYLKLVPRNLFVNLKMSFCHVSCSETCFHPPYVICDHLPRNLRPGLHSFLSLSPTLLWRISTHFADVKICLIFCISIDISMS